ncbi:MAG: hypothetical protein KGK09_00350, partial [Burkholderiales bacterium]|nr:hypothetical protein [Burkholderiales bacterium]
MPIPGKVARIDSGQVVTITGSRFDNVQTQPPSLPPFSSFGNSIPSSGGGEAAGSFVNPGDLNKARPTSKVNSQKPNCAGGGSGTGPESPTSDNPVKLSTGEKIQDETDFSSGGLYGLSLQRTYRSASTAGSMFGPHWLSNFEYPRLAIAFNPCTTSPIGDCVPRSVTYTDSDGTQYTYNWLGWTDDGHAYFYNVDGASLTGDLIYFFGKRWVLE